MTNEEAINILAQIKTLILNDESWLSSTKKPITESFDMAISALQENPKLIKEAERWEAYFEDEVANEW